MKEGLGKLIKMKKIYLNVFFLLIFGVCSTSFSQTNNELNSQYMIGGISFSGNSTLDNNTILSLINLQVGDNIFVPGEEIPNAVVEASLINSFLFILVWFYNTININLNK